jgi:hypothetical protein
MGKNSLTFIYYFIIFFPCIYSSINRPFQTKNSYSSQDHLYLFYMKCSIIENRWEKILYNKRFIKQEIQLVNVFPGAISWINMNELHFIQKYKRDNQELHKTQRQNCIKTNKKCYIHDTLQRLSTTIHRSNLEEKWNTNNWTQKRHKTIRL